MAHEPESRCAHFIVEVGGVTASASHSVNLGDLCHEHRLPVQFSCRGGACGTCLTRVIHGMENVSARSDNEEVLIPDFVADDGSYRLACQTVVHGPAQLQWVDQSDPVRNG